MSTRSGVVCGSVHSPGTSTQSCTTAHVIRVVPQMTSTSPTSSAPATICSPMASMVPPPTAAPPSVRPQALLPGNSSGSWSARAPASATTASSHPVKSNSGSIVMATTVSMAATPHSAWLATAWAGQ